MMRSVKSLQGFGIAATDGDIGTVDDVYFDDDKWTIRYLIVDTGGWLTGRKVLLSPRAVSRVNWSERTVQVDVTRQKVEDSASIDTDRPVSRQEESALHAHYGYPYYWGGPMLWGYTSLPMLMPPPAVDSTTREIEARIEQERDHHLRSSDTVIGYDIHATDGDLGHVQDFLFDEEDWSIRMMLVATRTWWPGKHVLLSPRRIDHVDWNEKTVAVNITRAEIENSPEYDPKVPATPDLRVDAYRPFGSYQ